MLSVAPLFSQHRARRALVIAVAVVKHLVAAGVGPAAGSVAARRFGAARDRRVDDIAAAVALEFVERNVGAHAAVTEVAELGTSDIKKKF